MSGPEFRKWPSIPRLNRDMIITEKIDGTNAAVVIEESSPSDSQDGWCGAGEVDGVFYKVGAQSRKRTITPEADNFGFAQWVRNRAGYLAFLLGPGYHYGEWWGHGIQRGYGLVKGERTFSLFNVRRYAPLLREGGSYAAAIPELQVVPVLYEGPFDTGTVKSELGLLRLNGSVAAPGYMNPEGVVVYHSAANQVFKATLEHDAEGKPLP